MTDRKSPLTAVLGLWKRLGLVARIAIVAGALAVILCLFLWSGSDGRYEPLFSGLDPADASEIVQILDEDKVSYRLGGRGDAILVPAGDVYRLRLLLASQGLPRGGVVGYELMDKTQLGSTDFERRVSYLRAMQGELTRTIMQVQGVEQVRVHIVLPEDSLFVSERRGATAAVLLRLRGGAELNKEQVRGIVHLVAHSVDGLEPQDVTVLDVYGRLLSAGIEDGAAGSGLAATSSQLDVQQAFQQKLQSGLQSLLEQVFGPGNVVARATAELNFDQRVIDTSTFEPAAGDQGVVKSVHELEEYFKGEGTAPGGVAGSDSNIPGYQAVTAAGGAGEYQRTETTRDMEVNQSTERVVIAPGTVERLSVAVVVNRTLTAAEEAAIRSTVASAIGFDDSRRDQITVSGVAFDTSLADELKTAMAADAAQRRQSTWMVALGPVLGLAIVFFLAGRARRRPKRAFAPQVQVPQAAGVRRALAASAAATAAGAGDAGVEVQLSPEARSGSLARREVDRLVRQRPEDVVQLLRTWMTEE